MSSILIKQLYRSTEDYINKNIKVSGWVKTERTSKNFGFIELNDGSFFKNLQIVFEEGLDNFNDIAKLSVGSAISAEGVLTESLGAKQPFEPVSYTHLRAHETVLDLVCRLLLEKKKNSISMMI